MKRKHLTFVAAMAVVLTSGAAQAGVVKLSGITAEWYDANPASNVNYTDNGTVAPKVRWPKDATTQSGYNFTVAGQPIEFDDVPPSPSGVEVLGTFTHLNFPIGSSITDIKLRITADVSIDNASVATGLNFNYGFNHWETPNGSDPCANGGAHGSGVNSNGCADRVIANWLASSQDFLVGADTYTLNVLGFSLEADGINPFTQFWTAEKKSNVAYLLGNVALRSDVVGGADPIPEPSSISLIGLGMLGGMFAYRRRKQADANK